jgi:hypothetical protein
MGERWQMLNINLKNTFQDSIKDSTKKINHKTQILMMLVRSLVFSESLNLANSVVLNDRKYLGFR